MNDIRQKTFDKRQKLIGFLLNPKRAIFLGISAIVFTIFLAINLDVSHVSAATGINSTINFQGKVVNSDGTNVADGQYTFVFKLHDAASGGANPWTETQNNVQVTGGIFRVSLGSVTTFASAGIDFNTDNLYLGINFNNDGEMTPRVRFAAVPYAFNAEKVAGLTVTNTTGTLTIPNSKTVQFGGAFTTSAQDLTLTLSGGTNVTLPTTGTLATLGGVENLSNKSFTSTVTFSGITTDITTGTNETLTISPNGTGNVLIQTGAGGQAALAVDKTGLGDIFAASSSGISKFVIKNDGTASSSAGFTVDGVGSVQSTNNQSLTLGGGSTGDLVLGRTSQVVTLPGFDCSGYGNAGKLTTTTGGILTCAADVSGGGSGSSNWVLSSANGTLSPINNTLDLLVGGISSQEAKFAILGVADTQTPVASVSATSGTDATKGIYLSGDGSLQSVRNNTLTIGGNTTGNIILNSNSDVITVSDALTLTNGTLNSLVSSGGTAFTLDADNDFASGNLFSLTENNGGTQHLSIDNAGNVNLNATSTTLGSGNTIYGDTDASSNLFLVSTSNATKGNVYFQSTSNYVNVTNDLFLGGDANFSGGNIGLGTSANSASNIRFNSSSNLDIYDVASDTLLTIENLGAGNRVANVYVEGSLSVGTSTLTGVGNFVGGNKGGNAALLINQTGASTNDIFAASSSGVTKFRITNDGTASSSAGFTIDGVGSLQSTNNQSLTIGGSSTGDLVIGRTSQVVTLPGFDCSGFGNSGKLTTTTGGVLTCAADISGGSGGSSNWTLSSLGSLYSNNNTLDILLGGNSSSSAAFKVTGQDNPFKGTLSAASVSANTSFAGLVIDQKGSGDILSASSSGLKRFTVENSGNVLIGTGSATEKLTINGGNFLQKADGNPTIKGSIDTTGTAQDVKIVGPYAYVADGSTGLSVFDVSNPSAPKLIGTADTSGNAQGVYVSGKYAYVADSASGLQVIDISNPLAPQIVATLNTPVSAVSVFVSANYVYLADSAELQIIDVTNPTNPVLVSSVAGLGAADVKVVGKYAYVIGSAQFWAIDISNPSNPVTVDSISTTDGDGLFISGKYAYVAISTLGLRIYDISNPGNIVLVGANGNLSGASDIFVAGDYAYIVTGSSGIKVVNIADPTFPKIVGIYDTSGSAVGTYVSGKYAYVADSSSGLAVIDINGADIPTMTVGALESGGLSVTDNANIGNNLNIANALNIGFGGLYANGAFSFVTASGAANLIQGAPTGRALLTLNQTGNQDIFTASASGVTKFVIKNDGTASSSAGFTVDGVGNVQSTKNQTLTVGGGSTGDLVIGRTSQVVTLPGFDCSGFGNSGKLTTTTGGVLTCAADISGGSGGSSNWTLSSLNGTLSPNNNSLDILVGGTSTQSAVFSVLGVAAGTNPSASVSAQQGANAGKGIYLSGDGGLQSVNMNNLAIGGNTTGNIFLRPGNGTGMVTITGTNTGSGGLKLISSESDLTAKQGRIKVGHYDNSEQPVTLIIGESNGSNQNFVLIGGGSGSENAATEVSFYTALNSNELVGTRRMFINNTGDVGIGYTASAPFARLHVMGGETGGNSAFIVDQIGNSANDIFAASSSGTPKFVIKNDGTASTSAGLTIDAVGSIQSTNNQTLTIGGNSTGDINIRSRDGSGAIVINDGIAGNTSTLELGSTRTTGSILGLGAPSSTTLTGNLIGIGLNLNTNYTATDFNATGISMATPTVSNTHSSTRDYYGMLIQGGAITHSSGTGTDSFNSIFTTMPTLTATTGSINSYGHYINFGTTTAANQTGLFMNMSNDIVTSGSKVGINLSNVQGDTVGTITGINIGGLSNAGGATENALIIGSGWDNQISGNGWSVDGSGNINVLSCSGCSGGSSANFWQYDTTTGIIASGNSTADILIGGISTQSAVFSVLGVAAGTNPSASVSAQQGANAGKGIYMSGDGGLQSVNMDNLTIGGITSGNIVLKPGNSSGLVKIVHGDSGNGGLMLMTSEADATTKNARIKLGHFTNSEEPISVLVGNNNGIDNNLFFGGGSGSENSATDIHFMTGAGPTSLGGTTRMHISRQGNVGIGNGNYNAPSKLFVSGTSNESALTIFNETGVNDIFHASAGGVLKFKIGGQGTAPVASVSGTTSFAGLVVDNTIGDLFTASSSGMTRFTIRQSGIVQIGEASNGITFDTLNGGPIYTGSARTAKRITLSPEYPGAILTDYYGAGTETSITGSIISDTDRTQGTSIRNYYEWNSSETAAQHSYTVAVRVTLPSDFSSWATSNALVVNYITDNATDTQSELEIRVYNENNATIVATSDTNNSEVSWTAVAIDDSTLDDGVSSEWDEPGETAVIYLRMLSQDDDAVRVGDIQLNYLSKY